MGQCLFRFLYLVPSDLSLCFLYATIEDHSQSTLVAMRFVLTTGAEPVASWTKINIFLKLTHWVLGSQLCKSDQSGFLCHIREMLTAMLEGCSRRSVGTIMWPPGWLVLWIIPVHVDRWSSSSDWQQWPERFLSITNKSSCCYVSDLWGENVIIVVLSHWMSGATCHLI